MWRGKAVRVPLASNDGGGRKRVGATSEDGEQATVAVAANETRVKGLRPPHGVQQDWSRPQVACDR
jgi:hypothetical protein